MTELIPEHFQRALRYLGVLNSQGVQPSIGAVNAYAVNPPPVKITRFTLAHRYSFLEDKVEPQPVVDYIVRTGWADIGPEQGIRLTSLGVAFINGLGEPLGVERFVDSAVVDMSVSVIDPEDRDMLDYFTRPIAEAGEGMLVDAYFKANLIGWLLQATKINKILVAT